MPSSPRPKQIDALMEQAEAAMSATDWFDAERVADKALRLARQSCDFDRMARIVMPLQEARRQRYQDALDVGTLTLIGQSVSEDAVVEPGCYIVQPPQVGADARRLRLAALQQQVPVAVVCREPLTQLRLCPIVAIGPGVTVRTKVDPPDDPEDPTLEWLVNAMEELGDAALEALDPEMATLKRLDALLGRIEAIPEHEGLHHALADTCRAAEREAAEDQRTGTTARKRAAKGGKKTAKTKSKG